jgi:hypothetical protein
VQAAPLHRHIDTLLGRLAGQRGPQVIRVSAGHVELDAGDRAVGEPVDPVDVGAPGRYLPGDSGDRRRGERAAQDRHVELATPPRRLPGAHRDLGVQAQIGGQRADAAVDRGQVRITRAGQQGAEDQLAPDDDLLDVQHAQVVRGEDGEQACRHPRPVPAGQGHQESGLRSAHRAGNATRGRAPPRHLSPRNSPG